MRKALRPTIERMESRLLLSSVVEGTSAAVVTGLYRQVLLRDPDARGLAWFQRQLDAGRTVQQVAGALYGSPEFRQGQVLSYYDELLEREPTPAELRKWTSVLIAGAPEERVVNGIAGSSEYFATSGGSDASFVRALYVDLLGRQPAPEELAGHVSRLQTGATPGEVTAQFTAGREYREAKVREVYQVVLDRAPDAAESGGWAARWQGRGGLRGVALGILGSGENLARVARPDAVTLPDVASAEDLRAILRAPYSEASTGFVTLFNTRLGTRPAYDGDGDPIASAPSNTALWSLMKTGGGVDGLPLDEVQPITPMTLDVATLIPLQSEIDIDKSLGFVLGEDPANSDLEEYLAGGAITPFGGPILTGGGGGFIADGHHRWSSIYVVNPYAQISAVDLGHERVPQDYLKITQVAVGAVLGFLQVQSVEGQNLFTIGRGDFDAWVGNTIRNGDDPDGVIEVFRKTKGVEGIDGIADYLWSNVERMRRFNQPVPGATSRDYMPQPPDGDLQPLLQLLESGLLNFRSPFIARIG